MEHDLQTLIQDYVHSESLLQDARMRLRHWIANHVDEAMSLGLLKIDYRAVQRHFEDPPRVSRLPSVMGFSLADASTAQPINPTTARRLSSRRPRFSHFWAVRAFLLFSAFLFSLVFLFTRFLFQFFLFFSKFFIFRN